MAILRSQYERHSYRAGSLGASGAILTILSYICVAYPDAGMQIMFLPFFTFKAINGIKAVMTFDTVGELHYPSLLLAM